MIFHSSDRKKLNNLIELTEAVQQQLISVRVDDVNEILKSIKHVGFIVDSLLEKIEVLDSKITSLDKQTIQYKLASAPSQPKSHKKK